MKSNYCRWKNKPDDLIQFLSEHSEYLCFVLPKVKSKHYPDLQRQETGDNVEGSFENEMMETERPKKQAQKESEINSSVLSLKTNLEIRSLFMGFIALKRVLKETLVARLRSCLAIGFYSLPCDS